MSSLRNSVRLVGFLGHSPEVKTTSTNKKVARVSLATNETHKNEKGEKVEETQWHQLVMWDHNATFAENYLSKGSEVTIEGKLNTRVYTDKEGTKRFITEIIVNEILIMAKK
jgi:single-strand DNA-binding protein